STYAGNRSNCCSRSGFSLQAASPFAEASLTPSASSPNPTNRQVQAASFLDHSKRTRPSTTTERSLSSEYSTKVRVCFLQMQMVDFNSYPRRGTLLHTNHSARCG